MLYGQSVALTAMEEGRVAFKDFDAKASSRQCQSCSQAADATKNEGSLALVATIKKEAEASLAFKPEYTADQPAANQAKFVEAYKTEMKKMIELVGKLEAAFKAGKNDEAAKVIADLDAQQKSSHKEFRKPKPKQ